ncbi:MAG: DNA-protecting protein DprA, partial [Rhodospirillales bacterium]|nr:DNA-protecting protein DprA [Rhodospirillales bacterium]
MREQLPTPLSDTERLSWLMLIRSENVGPMTFYRLLEQFGSAENAMAALPDLARQGGRRDYRPFPASQAETELATLERMGASLIGYTEPEYPPLLRAMEGAPPLISAKGALHLLSRTTIAVVGARNASANGLGFARKLSTGLGRGGFGVQDVVIASGLARGIDAAAHQGALETGTIAVLAGGIDMVYPAENTRLHDEIAERGVLLAEMSVGTKPTARLFPVRNRIISGLSRGVIVVEASPRSGSLITARTALD